MSQLAKAILYFVAATILSGCSKSVDCDVVTYHSLDRPSGERIEIVADIRNAANDTLFPSVSAQVQEALLAQGYQPVGNGLPDFIFAIRHGVGTGPDALDRVPRCSQQYKFHSDDYGSPYYRGLECYEQAAEKHNNYIHFLEVKVYDPVTYAAVGGAPLYDGLAQSLSTHDDQEKLLPYLVSALFDNFPGNSGEIRSVSVEFGDKK